MKKIITIWILLVISIFYLYAQQVIQYRSQRFDLSILVDDTTFVADSTTYLFKDGSNNLKFVDAVVGAKTLTELSTTTLDSDFVSFTSDTFYINDTNTKVTEDGSNNLIFVDAVTGTKTLAELSTTTLDSDFVSFTSDTFYINDTNTKVTEDGSNNLIFVDAVTGTKTLAELTATTSLDSDFVSFTSDTFYINDTNTKITEDGSNNLIFVDAVTGTKTLAELSAGGSADSSFKKITADTVGAIDDTTVTFINHIALTDDKNIILQDSSTVWQVLTCNFPYGWSTGPDWATSYGGWLFASSGTEQVFFNFRLPETWKEGSTIYPMIGWQAAVTSTGDAYWRFAYRWVDIDSTEEGTLTNLDILTAGTGTAFVHQEALFAGISGTGKHVGSNISGILARLGSEGDDDLAGDALLKTINIIIECDRYAASGAREK